MVKTLGRAFMKRFSVPCNCVGLSVLKLGFPIRLKYSRKKEVEREQCWRGEQRKELRAESRG